MPGTKTHTLDKKYIICFFGIFSLHGAQACGCFTALLRLLGSRLWDCSSLRPFEVLHALQRRIRGESGGGGWRSPCPNEAISRKVLEAMPLLVQSCSSRVAGSGGGGENFGGNRRRELSGVGGEEGSTGRGGSGGETLADAALEFLSVELASLAPARLSVAAGAWSTGSTGQGGGSAGRRAALTRALLGILEVCYGSRRNTGIDPDTVDDADDGREPTAANGPESWPWNAPADISSNGGKGGDGVGRWAAESSAAAGGSSSAGTPRAWWWPRAWPVRSMSSWGPRLADAAGDRGRFFDYRGGVGSGSTGGAAASASAAAVERAADVVGLVLRRHVGAAWRGALSALRGGSGEGLVGNWGGGTGAGAGAREGVEGAGLLPVCRPLLERICLELPLMDLPVVVHAAVFETHGLLALLPLGMIYCTGTVQCFCLSGKGVGGGRGVDDDDIDDDIIFGYYTV